MSFSINTRGLVKQVIELGGSIHPLIIPAELTNGTGLMNPSIYVDNDELIVNIRHVNYTLYHSENKKFQHRYGPLQYLHPENDLNLRTWNYLCHLDDDLKLTKITKVDTSKLDVTPIWEFVGLEDARIVRWDGKLYMTGVRRDTTTNGQGRMELSEIVEEKDKVTEISRIRIPAPGDNTSYCEKNWMPIIDKPFHYVKWCNPTEIIKYDVKTKTTNTVYLDRNKFTPNLPDFRGGSQAIPYGDYYLAIIHEVDLFKPQVGNKDAAYLHRFVIWDKEWNLVKFTDAFSFMNADIEFCCGAALYKDHLLITFGFQDNCAFVLKMPTDVVDKIIWTPNKVKVSPQQPYIPPSVVAPLIPTATPAGFDWGKIADHAWFQGTVVQEVFVDDVYQKFFSVEENDLVLDLGASVGPFGYHIKDKKPAKIICLEPEKDLFKTLTKNLENINVPLVTLNKGLSSIDGKSYLCGVFDPHKLEITNGHDGKFFETITFDTLLADNNITQIDFLKMDIEGAEYNIFNDEHFDWVTTNIKKVAAEIHLHTPEQKEQFRKFRDTYLKHFTNFEVLSLDYIDIKHSLWSEWFLEYYSAIMIYIDNRSADSSKQFKVIPIVEDKKKWQKYPAPTLEITTVIPEKGCVVDCVFCPQRTLEKVYTGTRSLSLDMFKTLIDKVPTDVRITFAGFTEPWMNRYCTDMLLYANEQGHPISVFTTGVGLTIDDLERIVDVPYAGNPNGGFILHLPDSELLARHPITPGYIKTLQWLKDNQHRIQNFSTMSMGLVHPSVSHLFDWAPTYQMWSRGANLIRESMEKPELITYKDRWKSIYHSDKNRTCGCVEHLYHNVLLPNGDVSLCCMDYGLDHILGNLNTQTYEDIIPNENSCYNLCNFCENGVNPKL